MSRFPASLPRPRINSPLDTPPLRWGILGAGWIAERFIESLHRNTNQQVVAVGSRSYSKASEFANRLGIERAHGSYRDLAMDSNVDIVYVATPHDHHYSCGMIAMEHGKHVLIEKPIALNAAEAEGLADFARAQRLFCMEALWMLFLPKFDVVRQLHEDGVLGEIETVVAEYGELLPADHRIRHDHVGGGPLLELGTYAVALAHEMLGKFTRVLASGRAMENGVNGHVSAILTSATGADALIQTTLYSYTASTAMIGGSKASIHMDGPFCKPGGFRLFGNGTDDSLHFDEPRTGHDGLYHQALEAARVIHSGGTESPLRTLDASIQTMASLDNIRHELGIPIANAVVSHATTS